MRGGNHLDWRFRGWWPGPQASALRVGVVLLLCASGGAAAAGASSVVPPNGHAAGHGYGYWLQRSWQFIFSSPPQAKPCETLSTGTQRVGYLTLATLAPGTYKFTCTEPPGRPLYVDELSAECSTFKGDHGNFGTAGPQLKRCAHAMFNGLKNTTMLDGHPVDMQQLIAQTDVYQVQIPKNNSLGARPGKGRSAAYGYGLLLSGLGKANYVIHSLAGAGAARFDVTWTVQVW
jgi:hypothetical protein